MIVMALKLNVVVSAIVISIKEVEVTKGMISVDPYIAKAE